MKTKYTMFRRGEMFYMQDSATGKQTSLCTKDETEARSLLAARNAAQRQPVLNLHLARAYLTASDPAFVERTWQVVMEQMQSRTISYFRMKTGLLAQFTISKKLETVLSHVPTTGTLFPKLSTFTANGRASRFRRRWHKAGVTGVPCIATATHGQSPDRRWATVGVASGEGRHGGTYPRRGDK